MILPHAELYLDGRKVGIIHVQGNEDSWHHGSFRPTEEFSQFATLFGRWSLLMHAEDDQTRQSREDLDELRKLEYQIDALQARIFYPVQQVWHTAAQLNIDGALIEWKEY